MNSCPLLNSALLTINRALFLEAGLAVSKRKTWEMDDGI